MKKYNCFIYFFAIAFLLFSCQNSTPAASGPSTGTGTGKKKNLGRIEFREELHNFGTVKEGEVVACSFLYSNNGDAPVRLTKVETGCGCLSVKYDQVELKPGETSVLEVIFHSGGEWGNQVKTVGIETSSGQAIQLTIGAFVENMNFNFELNK